MSKVVLAAHIFGRASPLRARARVVKVKTPDKAVGGRGAFEPAIVHIRQGDRVRFVARQKGHRVESVPGLLPDGAAAFSGSASEDLIVKFDQPGIYGYRCVPQDAMGMVGLVVVGAPADDGSVRSAERARDTKARFEWLVAALAAAQPARK